jgi:hypothetical protein
MVRKPISKSVRFEVFKRDSFTCQYCGNKAPDIILHIDHIQPISKGGDELDITNLITSCSDCNLGKGARELSDDAVILKRKKQLDELQERREQLEMMVDWSKSLIDIDKETVKGAIDFWDSLTYPEFSLNENGCEIVRKTVTKYGLSETLECMRISASQYIEINDGKKTMESVSKAIDYVGRIANNRKRLEEKPYMRELYYIRGIMKKRFNYVNDWEAISILEKAYKSGIEIDDLKEIVINAGNWSGWRREMENAK